MATPGAGSRRCRAMGAGSSGASIRKAVNENAVAWALAGIPSPMTTSAAIAANRIDFICVPFRLSRSCGRSAHRDGRSSPSSARDMPSWPAPGRGVIASETHGFSSKLRIAAVPEGQPSHRKVYCRGYFILQVREIRRARMTATSITTRRPIPPTRQEPAHGHPHFDRYGRTRAWSSRVSPLRSVMRKRPAAFSEGRARTEHSDDGEVSGREEKKGSVAVTEPLKTRSGGRPVELDLTRPCYADARERRVSRRPAGPCPGASSWPVPARPA